jgi:hypothetical protein
MGTTQRKHLTGMKSYHFRLVIIWGTFVLATAYLWVGCGPYNADQVAGRYVRNYRGVIDSISIDINGRFRQDIIYTNGGQWFITGSWKVINRAIQFNEFYLSYDDEKNETRMPPLRVYSCVFVVNRYELTRTTLQPNWIKQ